jgi:hypothetical protein
MEREGTVREGEEPLGSNTRKHKGGTYVRKTRKQVASSSRDKNQVPLGTTNKREEF